MLEFAIAALLLVTLFTGAFQYGYGAYVYNNVQTGVNSGARYASLSAYDSASEEPSRAFLAAVRNLVVYGDPAGGGDPVAPGLAPEHVKLAVSFSQGAPASVTVWLQGYAIDTGFQKLVLNGRPSVTYPFTGVWSPPGRSAGKD